MKKQSFAFNRKARRRGTIMYIMAGGVVMLLGCAALAVDYAVLINDKNHLQRVCDAAALGGATKLPDQSAARIMADRVVRENNFRTDANNTITYAFPTATRMRVSARRDRSLFFAKVLGQNVGVVRASALVGVTAGTPSIAPIGIPMEAYNAENPVQTSGERLYDTGQSPIFTTRLIDHKKEAFNYNPTNGDAPPSVKGEFILFDLRDSNAKSPEQMARQLAGIQPVNITPSDLVTGVDPPDATTVNAKSQDDFLFDGMGARFYFAGQSPWRDIDSTKGTSSLAEWASHVGQNYQRIFNGTDPIGNGSPFYQNPRVMSLIVTDSTGTNTNGTLNAPVRALAPVYARRIYKASNVTYLEYQYLPGRLVGSGSGTLLE